MILAANWVEGGAAVVIVGAMIATVAVVEHVRAWISRRRP